MASKRHTPGPWQADKPFEGHVAVRDRMICSAMGHYDGRESTRDENIANARLIALAPEMLDFVRTQRLKHAPHGDRQRCLACGLDGNCCGTFFAADALLKKAEGTDGR